MSNKDKFGRAFRAGLNRLLDEVHEFEEEGGFQRLFERLDAPSGWETIGEEKPTGPPKTQKSIREYYANLEVPFGSDMETVKEAYRNLMRQYHPDKHSGDPRMEALATELSQELTRAYQAIESYLTTGRY